MIEEKIESKSISRYKVRRVLYIAVFWTLIDLIVKLLNVDVGSKTVLHSLLLREALVFVMSALMGYLFVYGLKKVIRTGSLLVNFSAKSLILLVAALLMNYLVHFVEGIFILEENMLDATKSFLVETMDKQWLIKKMLYWLVLFLITQLYLEINDKYAPGVFLDIVSGKYTKPKIENRIVMFIDLTDSTPIAERLGHEKYFLFIREFIHAVSLALIEQGGIIYQYVGDEVVVSWTLSQKNTRNCLKAVIAARRNLQKRSTFFRNTFDVVPQFRVGIHVGEVTVGEIGVIKKDLAMSGDTMNTTARIRGACNEFNEKFIVSKSFVEESNLKNFQVISLGKVDLKGKADSIELYSLKI